MFLHEDYDECTHMNDLALFELTYNVSSSRGMPICMPAKALRITRKLKAIGSGVESRELDYLHHFRRFLK